MFYLFIYLLDTKSLFWTKLVRFLFIRLQYVWNNVPIYNPYVKTVLINVHLYETYLCLYIHKNIYVDIPYNLKRQVKRTVMLIESRSSRIYSSKTKKFLDIKKDLVSVYDSSTYSLAVATSYIKRYEKRCKSLVKRCLTLIHLLWKNRDQDYQMVFTHIHTLSLSLLTFLLLNFRY